MAGTRRLSHRRGGRGSARAAGRGGGGLRRSRAGSVGWGAALEEACAGTRPVVMVGNEFLDTLPVHLVRVGGRGRRARRMSEPRRPAVWSRPGARCRSEAAAELETPLRPAGPGAAGRLSPRTASSRSFPGLAASLAAGGRRHAGGQPGERRLRRAGSPGSPSCGERWGLEDRLAAEADGARLLQAPIGARLHWHGRAGRTSPPTSTSPPSTCTGAGRGSRRCCSRPWAPSCAAAARRGAAEALTPAQPDEADVLEADRQATVLRSLLDDRDLGGAFKVMVQVRE